MLSRRSADIAVSAPVTKQTDAFKGKTLTFLANTFDDVGLTLVDAWMSPVYPEYNLYCGAAPLVYSLTLDQGGKMKDSDS